MRSVIVFVFRLQFIFVEFLNDFKSMPIDGEKREARQIGTNIQLQLCDEVWGNMTGRFQWNCKYF